MTFLGDGAPDPDAGPPHAPQVLRRPDAVILLVSPTLAVARVGEAFTAAREAHAEPKARALALKAQLRELSAGHRFSFVLVDLVASRVFAASTALSSPLALGHEADGTLLVTCTRSGAKAATAWPPRWNLPGRGRRARGGGGKLAHQYGKSPGSSSTTPATPDRGRCVSPAWTERSRSRSPGASSTHSAGSSASDSASAYAAQITTHLNHLPAGRFVYGRRHLQPFEFSAFWHSAESNRAGTRAARSPEDEPLDDARAPRAPSREDDAETMTMAWGGSDANGGASVSTWRAGGGGGGGFGSADRKKYSSTGSRGDVASTWRKKEPTPDTPPGRNERWTRREEAPKGGAWRAEAPASAPTSRARAPAASSPSSSPSSSSPPASDDARNRTWPGGRDAGAGGGTGTGTGDVARFDRDDASAVAERASFVGVLRENVAGSTAIRAPLADRIGELASQTRAWGGTGSLDELLARRDASERSRRRSEGMGELTRALTSPATSLGFAAG